MQILKTILFASFLLTLFACTENGGGEDPMGTTPLAQRQLIGEAEEPGANGDEIAELPKEQHQQIIQKYLELKDALVASDEEMAQKTAAELAKATGGLQAVQPSNIRDAAHSLAEMEELEKQREYFSQITGEVYTLVKANGSQNQLYRQYCSMAFDNTGAFWLATEREINNPYMSETMPKCGEVVEMI